MRIQIILLALGSLLGCSSAPPTITPSTKKAADEYCRGIVSRKPELLAPLFSPPVSLDAIQTVTDTLASDRWTCEAQGDAFPAADGIQATTVRLVRFALDSQKTARYSLYVTTQGFIRYDGMIQPHPGTSVARLIYNLRNDDPQESSANIKSLKLLGVPTFGYSHALPVGDRVVALNKIKGWWRNSDGAMGSGTRISPTDREFTHWVVRR